MRYNSLLVWIMFCVVGFFIPTSSVMANSIAFSSLGEIYFIGQSTTFYKKAPFNLNNDFLQLPQYGTYSESRVELNEVSDNLDLKVRVRGVIGLDTYNGEGKKHSDLYASQAYGRFKFASGMSINIGRQLLTWGPATFRSPSNPFYFDAGHNQPLRELSGLDAIVSSFYRDSWSFAATHVFSSGHVGGREGENFSGSQIGSVDYQGVNMLRFDMLGDGFNFGLVYAHDKKSTGFVGEYAAYELNDAWKIWEEAGLGKRPWSIKRNNTGYIISNPSNKKMTFLAGVSYAKIDGQSIYLEYLFDGHGMNKRKENNYFLTGSNASSMLNGSSSPMALSILNTGINYEPVSVSNHYLSTFWQSNLGNSHFYWRAMLVANIVDHSYQPSFYCEYNFNNRSSFIVSLATNRGSLNSEFGSLVHNSFMLGIKLNIF